MRDVGMPNMCVPGGVFHPQASPRPWDYSRYGVPVRSYSLQALAGTNWETVSLSYSQSETQLAFHKNWSQQKQKIK